VYADKNWIKNEFIMWFTFYKTIIYITSKLILKADKAHSIVSQGRSMNFRIQLLLFLFKIKMKWAYVGSQNFPLLTKFSVLKFNDSCLQCSRKMLYNNSWCLNGMHISKKVIHQFLIVSELAHHVLSLIHIFKRSRPVT
jgi:hypothetical protein